MSSEAIGWVWRNSPYSGAQLLVHLAIGDVVNDLYEYEFFMSTDSLAKKAKVARSTVVTTLSDMVERGFLEVLEAGGASRKPTRYRWTSATTAPTSAIRPSPLARSPRTNSKKPIEQKRTSAVTGLAEPDVFAKDAAAARDAARAPWLALGLTRKQYLASEYNAFIESGIPAP